LADLLAKTRLLAARLPQLRVLPPHVARFHARALIHALRVSDDFAVQSATRAADVALLLELARGRRYVVELGTATGWTTAAFALADPGRSVLSFDPVVQPHRDEYLALVPARARERIELVQKPGVEGPQDATSAVDLLFIDSTHEREATVAEFRAWRPRLRPSAIVVFHDYDNPAFPGVREAVEDLSLSGDARAGSFVWTV
jgi:predicted O-methyltransferase YrrM